MAHGRGNAHGWNARDTLFVAVIVAFGVLAALAGVALAMPASPILALEGDTDCKLDVAAGSWNATGHESGSTTITGRIGSLPTGCR